MNSVTSNILVFDSGVGGLSVYQEIQALMPNNNYIYLFDNEAYPYGELTEPQLLERVENLVVRIVKDEMIDVVVIACNTASTIVLPLLRRRLTIPVVGVVPAIKPACKIAKKGIGLLATPATVKRKYTQRLIDEFSQFKPVELIGSTALVNMAEKKLRNQAVDLDKLEIILKPFTNKVDVIVLGCTHFPFLHDEIHQVVGKSVVLMDSGKAIAKRVKSVLNTQEINRKKTHWRVYSSAPLINEGALELVLQTMGFTRFAVYPYCHFLDR